MNWTFIGLTSLLILCALVLLANSLFKKRIANSDGKTPDIVFLKDQLDQLDKEVELGITEKSDAEFSKVKISRKILHFANELLNKNQEHNAPIKITILIWCSIAIFVSLGTYKIYDFIGGDVLVTRTPIVKNFIPKDNRKNYLSQAVAEQLLVTARESKQLTNGENNTLIKLVKELKNVLEQRPNDLPGHILLVKNSARLNDFITARKAQEKVLILLGERANSFSYSNYAELCIKAASGYLSLEAAMAIEKALSIDPDNPQAKFYSSLQFLQENKTSATFIIWTELLDKEPIDSKWVTMIVAKIATISSSFNLEKEVAKKPTLELSSSLLPLLKLLNSLELRLHKKSGSIKDWIVLIESYRQINIESKVNQNIEKVKSLFSLTESQVIELESYKR